MGTRGPMRASKRIAYAEPTVSDLQQEALATTTRLRSWLLAGIERDIRAHQEALMPEVALMTPLAGREPAAARRSRCGHVLAPRSGGARFPGSTHRARRRLWPGDSGAAAR